MTFPQYSDKHIFEDRMTRHDMLCLHPEFDFKNFFVPSHAVILFQKDISHLLQDRMYAMQSCYFGDVYWLTQYDNRIALISNFGVGAPAATLTLENLIALGTKFFVSLGTAGALQRNLKEGDLVVAKRAIRDEGTSHHYLPPGKYSYPSRPLLMTFMRALADLEYKSIAGTVWTTDAPYRETETEINYYKKKCVLCAEMEIAALYAVAQRRNVNFVSASSISDKLTLLHQQYKKNKSQEGIINLVNAAIRTFELETQ